MSKSTVVRGASKAASIWNKIDAAVQAKGGSEDALDILDKKEGAVLVAAIADLVVTAELKTRNSFLVEVDYTKLFTDMVKAGGYDFVNGNIVAKNFPVEGTGLVELELIMVRFDWVISSQKVIYEMNKRGLVPCKIEHLLALGAKYPGLQKEYPIICLGSSWVDRGGGRYVPSLSWSDNERKLCLDWFGYGWNGDWCFAAIRK